MFKVIALLKLAFELKKLINSNMVTIDQITEQLADILDRAGINKKYTEYLRNLIEEK